jgi:hypothetical protein
LSTGVSTWTEAQLGAQDSDTYVAPGGKKLRLALFWVDQATATFNAGLLSRADEMLAQHGLGLDVWPSRVKSNASLIAFEDRLVERTDYDLLMDRASALIPDAMSARYLRIFICQFRYTANGLTVSDTAKMCYVRPFCLVDPFSPGDNVTLLHEVGHAAGLDHEKTSTDPMNRTFMNEANTRTRMQRFQIDKLVSSFFCA